MTTLGANGFLGDHQSGSSVRDANVAATNTLQSIMKTSMGPCGLDKMLVDQTGEVTISNDGSTILKVLEVNHPVGKLLVELSQLQDKEVGDGTTSVVVFAAELCKQAHALISKHKIHPTSIISGYKLAANESMKFINAHMTRSVDCLNDTDLLNISATTLSSKLLGSDSAHFGQIAVDAIKKVHTVVGGKSTYPIGAINVLKVHGQSIKQSFLVEGYALDRVGRSSQGMPHEVENAKIALIDFPLKQHRTQMGVSVEITDAGELEKVREMERDICKQKIDTILKSGANVIFTTQGFDDMALKYLVAAGVFGVRRVAKVDMKRLAKSIGATVCISMTNMDQEEEVFDPAWLGSAKRVSEKKVGDWDFVFVEQPAAQQAMSVILRGANEFMLDEIERSFHDALCVVSRTLESKTVVAGGGCVETAVSVHLENFSRSLGSKDQSAVRAFAESLLVIPKTLCINAALDSNDLVSHLRAKHTTGQRDRASYAEDGRYFGVDLEGDEKIKNMFEAGVIEPAINKKKAIKNATETAATILRIDDIVKLYPPPEEAQR
eukprot:GHVH01000333.1.p1 GENE.GHVH01000333.1~~GHVH01000333.1.p1  ORF type:complete len:550 (-),score=108.41 GHVH01000333.1:1028-2677(-)